MSGFYRLEFVKGPHDGLAVEGNTLFAPCLRLPNPVDAEASSAAHPAAPHPSAPRSAAPKNPTALYELSQKSLRWEEGGPQAVLRYEFRGPLGGSNPGRLARWFEQGRHRIARWMMAPVSYPMTTRTE